MKLALGFFAAVSMAFAAMEGRVTNATSGKPQANAVLTLIELGQGMKNVGSVKSDAQGKFKFDVSPSAGTPYLIQALHQGVNYNKMVPPGAPPSDLAIEVYDAASNVPDAKVSQDMILLEKAGDKLIVNETVIFSNEGKTTLQRPDGNLKIQVPPSVTGPISGRITAPQGMPITREPEKGKEPNTWVVKYPIKPGETRIDFSYSMPATEVTKFEGRILHGGGPVRFVAPQGVKLESPALMNLGPEPRTRASVYELKGAQFAINVSGTGQLRAAAAAESEQPQEDNTPGIDMVKPRLYQRLPWVLGFAFAMLALGFVTLYSKGTRA